MSSPSDSEKSASDHLYISDNAQSSSSSSPSNSHVVIDVDTETSRENPIDLVDTSKKGKQIVKVKKPKNSGKYLKIYDSRYQEWVDAGSSPSTSSGRKSVPNPQIVNAPYACETGGLATTRADILNDVKEPLLRFLEISKMPSLYYFDPRIPFRLPEDGEALDSWSSDTIALSFESFRYVNPFPLPTIALKLCVFYEISPS